ncbi:YraN family protein [Leptospira congkakensis]|uniref:YraN family protein n=1 Tax=Leptospira congkakensis TaxID=2484932 RepID=A0A4Z1AGM5_9LEPT|nr:YraN family protein [Leptospira congkakensis]TGL90545.1 YraN family protein [Leptospira congkakensis]TGL91552.1 YraN family protein [Leptospira congkakensis]TGL98606.1 YraN family protein [Leptospira congkakensis]
MREKTKRGRLGEEIAAAYLEFQGHLILFQNYRKAFGELDIISISNDFLHCSEVKFWNESSGFHPLECFHETKRRRMRKVYYYLLKEIPAFYHLTPSFNLIHITEKKEVLFYSSIF